MAQRYFNLGDLFTAISNALRSLKGTSVDIVADDFPSEISGITKKSEETYNTSTTDQTIDAGQYLSGAQTIRKVTTSNISAANIKSGVTVKVGDTDSAGRIANVTGTFTSSSTVSSGQTAATANKIVSGYSAWVNGSEVKGSIASRTNADLTHSAISKGLQFSGPSGHYASNLSLSVTDDDLVAANIKDGVGIFGATGTFTDASTVSSGQTAAAAGQILSGYSAWVDGAEVKGSLPDGSVTVDDFSFTNTPQITVGTNGLITAGVNQPAIHPGALSATVSPGRVSSATSGDFTIKVYNTKQLTTKAATTYNTSTSNQTIASGQYLTGTQTIRAVTTSNISPENIKAGVVVKVGDAGSAGRIKNVTGTYTGGPEGMRDKVHFFSGSSFTLATNNTSKNWDGTIEYSTNGTTWTTWTGAAITAVESNYEYHIYLRGTGNTYLTMVSSSPSGTARFVFTGSMIESEGDLDALLDYEIASAGKYPPRATSWAAYLFYNCSQLISAPTLSSIILSASCYNYMFYGSGLLVAPALPATTLQSGCYSYMFNASRQLTTPPALPATAVAPTCYNGMFYNCSGLEALPALPALKIQSNSYNQMFRGCIKIKLSASNVSPYTNAYRIPVSGTGDGSASNAMSNMFYGTGGSFTGTPTVNTTYYTSNAIVS